MKSISIYSLFLILILTLELKAEELVFFETVPFTDIDISRSAVWAILIGVGIVKGYGIAAFFMHLRDEHKWFNITFMFPWIFVALMLWGIGLSNPEGISGLPSWCTPDWSYATER